MGIEIILLIVVIVLLLIFFATVIFLLLKKNFSKTPGQLDTLNTRLDTLRDTIDTRLDKNSETMNSQMNRQFEQSNKLIKDITQELVEVKTTGREMLSFTEQLQSLEKTLKNPQRRGALGEYVLEQVIANVLPPDVYKTQYTFKSGVRVDAVVFLQENKIICIDAKFSLDTYTKIVNNEEEDVKSLEKQLKEDIKNRIQETSKYILPDENTLDYAFMFIPSEALYYDLLTQKIGGGDTAKNMLEYAFSEYKVIIVSPTTLLAYLQTVNLGLRSLKIEESAKDIIKHAETLQRHMKSHSANFAKVGRHLGTAVTSYNTVQTEYSKIDKDFLKITQSGGDYKKIFLDKPYTEEE